MYQSTNDKCDESQLCLNQNKAIYIYISQHTHVHLHWDRISLFSFSFIYKPINVQQQMKRK